jgi:hypothetical protein
MHLSMINIRVEFNIYYIVYDCYRNANGRILSTTNVIRQLETCIFNELQKLKRQIIFYTRIYIA